MVYVLYMGTSLLILRAFSQGNWQMHGLCEYAEKLFRSIKSKLEMVVRKREEALRRY